MKVKVEIDESKHVKPLETTKAKIDPTNIDDELGAIGGKLTTLQKYSYYEASNQKWVKCLINIPGIKSHPKDKIEVRFTERTLDVIIYEWGADKTETLHFGVRKLHCKTIAEKNKWALKDDGIQVSLKKLKEADNWWSFFKQKATGEVESDED